jgi:hypothetical protein
MGLNRNLITSLVETIGSLSVVIGVGMFSIPAALIVGGILLMLAGAANA